tara:strand:- start:468 stop:659 length:192 start_codon:yes stop_codon:yes gene_type:complete
MMSIIDHTYEGNGLFTVNTTAGPFEVHLVDPLGKQAEVRKPDGNTPQWEGSMTACREWLEATQ